MISIKLSLIVYFALFFFNDRIARAFNFKTAIFSQTSRQKLIKQVSIAILSTGLISSSLPYPSMIARADELANTATTAQIDSTPTLTANQLLETDIKPRISLLKDIVTSFSQYDSYVENKDYQSIRSALRLEPTVELRKTCRSLEKYLPSDKLTGYKKAYEVMISSIDDLDSVRCLFLNSFVCP
jgi:hypothetical protein